MNNGIGYFLSFGLGAAAGAVVAWHTLKTKYANLAEEEIAEVRNLYRNRQSDAADTEPDAEEKTEAKPDASMSIREYAAELAKHKYVNYSGNPMPEDDIPEEDPDVFVIEPEMFGNDDEFETIGLTYYEDGVLADDMDNVIEDVENLIGAGSLNRIGEYADDAVYVRNMRMKCDYEVICVSKRYSDVIKNSPRPAEG